MHFTTCQGFPKDVGKPKAPASQPYDSALSLPDGTRRRGGGRSEGTGHEEKGKRGPEARREGRPQANERSGDRVEKVGKQTEASVGTRPKGQGPRPRERTLSC